MTKAILICDLRTCQAVAGTIPAMQPKVTTQYWLPKPIYYQLNESGMKRMKYLEQRKIVRFVEPPSDFPQRFGQLCITGISMTDYFVVLLASEHHLSLLCSPDWYRTVSSYFSLPALNGFTSHEETSTAMEAVVSGARSTTHEKTAVLLITSSIQPIKPIGTR